MPQGGCGGEKPGNEVCESDNAGKGVPLRRSMSDADVHVRNMIVENALVIPNADNTTSPCGSLRSGPTARGV